MSKFDTNGNRVSLKGVPSGASLGLVGIGGRVEVTGITAPIYALVATPDYSFGDFIPFFCIANLVSSTHDDVADLKFSVGSTDDPEVDSVGFTDYLGINYSPTGVAYFFPVILDTDLGDNVLREGRSIYMVCNTDLYTDNFVFDAFVYGWYFKQ